MIWIQIATTAALWLAYREAQRRVAGRRARIAALARLGRLASPLALPAVYGELRDPCGHLASFGCSCADRAVRPLPAPRSLPSGGVPMSG